MYATKHQQYIDRGLLKVDESTILPENVDLIFPLDTSPHAISIGKNCRVASGTVIYAGAHIGDNCEMGHHVIIGNGVRIGANNKIEHGCVLSTGVQLGDTNNLYPYTMVTGPTTIGNRNEIGPFATIGTKPQHRSYDRVIGVIQIGDGNVFREYVTVHGATSREVTRIGNECYIMAYNHTPHDALIDDHVTIANNCQLGGHTYLMHHANLGLSTVTHQHSVIGAGTMVGMGSVVTKDIPPFLVFVVDKARRLNEVGLARMGRSAEEISELAQWYSSNKDLELAARVEQAADQWWYSDFKAFLLASERNICKITDL